MNIYDESLIVQTNMKNINLLSLEQHLWESGHTYIAGVDEAGRGPLAGPVVAAAVIFPENIRITGINDSKKLSPRMREMLFSEIEARSLSCGIGCVGPIEIDRINILQATLNAMRIALQNLLYSPDYVLIDGNKSIHALEYPQSAIVKGDQLSLSIAAASIMAKVYRDRLMCEFDSKYPEYGFAQHKGYPTRKHVQAIHDNGYCPIHRRSFNVRKLI